MGRFQVFLNDPLLRVNRYFITGKNLLYRQDTACTPPFPPEQDYEKVLQSMRLLLAWKVETISPAAGTVPPQEPKYFALAEKMKSFLFVFECISMPGSRHGLGRRAFVDMFVFANSRAQAEDTAIRYLNHSGWLKVALLAAFERQGPPPNWDKRWVKAYRQAEYYGVGLHVGVLPLAHQPGVHGGDCP